MHFPHHVREQLRHRGISRPGAIYRISPDPTWECLDPLFDAPEDGTIWLLDYFDHHCTIATTDVAVPRPETQWSANFNFRY